MRVKLAYPVYELHGAGSKPVGIVFAIWRGVHTARAYVVPRNPKSDDQVLIRAFLTTAAQAFKLVTPAEKLAWEQYAALRPKTILGEKVVLPAISMYTAVNTIVLVDTGAVDDAAPTALCDFTASAIATFAYNSGTTHLTFDVTHNAAVVTDKKWLVRISPSLPSGAYEARDGDMRLACGVATESIIPVTASPQTIDLTAPRFGDWDNAAYMAIEVLPLSPDYDAGLPLRVTDQVTVT